MARLLLVEDELKLGATLKEGLERAQYTVDLARDGEEALDFARVGAYDVIVLDIMLPKLSGFEVCQQLRTDGVRTPILMLTARDAVADRIKGLDTGADDYLVKPFAFGELLARIRSLLRRDAPTRDAIVRVAELTLDPAAQRVEWQGKPIDLTAREYRILETLMRRPTWIVSREGLIESVWGFDFTDTSNLVEVYIGRHSPQADRGWRAHADPDGTRRRLPSAGASLVIRRMATTLTTRRWSQLPARTRLTLWYVALLAGTLMVLIGLGQWLTSRSLYATQDDLLRSKAAAVATEVDMEKGRIEFPDDGPRNVFPSVADGLSVVRVWDREGGQIFKGMPIGSFPDRDPATLDARLRRRRTASRRSRTLMIRSACTSSRLSGRARWSVRWRSAAPRPRSTLCSASCAT